MPDVPPEINPRSSSKIEPAEAPSLSVTDRSRSAKCSPLLRRRRPALNHCSPKGRLRLIQFLQNLGLDNALHSLSDECTLEDILHTPCDALRSMLTDGLSGAEIDHLVASLQKYEREKGSRSPAPTYRSRRYSDFSLVNRSLSSSLSESPVVRCSNVILSEGEQQMGGGEKEENAGGASIPTSTHSESAQFPTPKLLSNMIDQAPILQRTSSLGVGDSCRVSRFRPASLSVTVPSPSHFLSSMEVVGNPVVGGRSSPAPILATGTSNSLFSVSPQCSFFDKHRRRSGDRACGLQVGGGGGGGMGCVWDAAASSTATSSLSHRSSLLLVPPAYQAQLSNPLSTASPGSSAYPQFTSHSIGSNLLRMRQGYVGQSAPNLFSSCLLNKAK
uniref:Non-specific serine/threonine protein kinase n=1 Tax=Mesocestoides corti TaxID=53468 RepID=A0A5K3FZ49_MESCO